MLLCGDLLAVMGRRTCRALVPQGCVGQSSSGAGRCTSLWCWVGEAEGRHLGGLAEYELKGFDGFINRRWMWVTRQPWKRLRLACLQLLPQHPMPAGAARSRSRTHRALAGMLPAASSLHPVPHPTSTAIVAADGPGHRAICVIALPPLLSLGPNHHAGPTSLNLSAGC